MATKKVAKTKKTVKKSKVVRKAPIKVEKEMKKTNPRILIGEVVGNKANKTLRVRVEVKYAHPLYTKILKKYKNFLVHSEEVVELGKIVRFKETRPISKSKSWILIETLKGKE